MVRTGARGQAPASSPVAMLAQGQQPGRGCLLTMMRTDHWQWSHSRFCRRSKRPPLWAGSWASCTSGALWSESPVKGEGSLRAGGQPQGGVQDSSHPWALSLPVPGLRLYGGDTGV